ncbi:hypothetical protein [Streptomyces sp. NBC_00878]|uniref:hypothetical protein n=1 Tax=Streptomyces sp. NBC_00878 TaxID=2975854 RepID=UPI0022569A85|nr:hypothetical protein [Streptomyces sp. NBC_00878]MCX4906483.1 hypothetical protein [Streptomyces sp. NBC_00878]
MTHNGQGDEPSARPAREGIVLPSDGGEPLLPGQTGDRAIPAGGQAWDQPWGPGPAPGTSPEPGPGWTPAPEWGNAGQDQGQGRGQGQGQGQGQGAQAPGWGTRPADAGGAAAASGAPAQDAPPQISSWTAPPPAGGAQTSGWNTTPSGPGGQSGQGGQGGQGGPAAQTPGWDGSAPGSGAQGGGGYAGQSSQYAAPAAPYGTHGAGAAWGGPQAAGPGSVPDQRSDGATPLPQEGTPTNGYGAPQTPQTPGMYAPDSAQAQAQPQGSAGAQAPGGYGYPQASGGQAPVPYASGGQTAAPLPPAGAGAGAGAGVGTGAGAGALPPAAPMDEGATQFLPPVPAAPAVDEGATQFLPPVGPGALPPEMPAAGASSPASMSAESTRFLGRARQDGPGPTSGGSGAGPLPPAVDPDAQPTQFIPPVPAQPGAAPYGARAGVPEDRQQQPPAEFDNLFRADAGDAGGSTQQLPRARQPQVRLGAASGFGTPGRPVGLGGPGGAPAGFPGSAGPAGPAGPSGPAGRGGRRGAGDGDNGRGGRTSSRVPVIAAVGVGIAVLGIGAGALLSGGGDDKGDDNKPVAATAPATGESGSGGADPAKEQAVALDKLLADSGDSRDSVVKAVDNVRKCANLAQAATDLRDAAKQRDGLVTSLAALSVDKLPDHARLTTALNSAWKASAAADNHYAAWAGQVAGKKGCNKGQARATGQTAAGNRQSGIATTQKAKAAQLWNTIAQTYGLTERQPGQL